MPSAIPGLTAPNAEIQELYNAPLPDHKPLFREALCSADAFDEEGLSIWKAEPPFAREEDSTDPYSAQYIAFMHTLVSVMHADFLENGWRTGMEKLREEVRCLLQRWETVTRLSCEQFYRPYHDSREYAMLFHYRQWLSHTIFSLYHLKFMHDRESAYEVAEESTDSVHVPLVNLRTNKTTHDPGQGAKYPYCTGVYGSNGWGRVTLLSFEKLATRAKLCVTDVNLGNLS
ncbi:hypothetical protein B0H13DRAFT_1910881 [Mycena leptocephala]|nr:hypothetical protein B0H13DRAFT_1910881 [Mycena leptocephala]